MSKRLTQAMQWSTTSYMPHPPYVMGVLEGEGIGPEVIRASLSMIDVIEDCTEYRFDVRHGGKIGIAALKDGGSVLSPEVIDFSSSIFANRGAIFCGPGGGRFVYDLRKEFDLYCKFVPIRPLNALHHAGVLKPANVAAVDILMVRENMGGVYQGSFALEESQSGQLATHTFSYDEHQVARILQVAIHAAKARRKKLCVITKPGGAPTISALWQQQAEKLAGDEIELRMLEVDHAAYQMIADAKSFDVVVAPNMFGDIIADGAALLLGSRGLSYSANFGDNGIAVYQTGHGAAYDIAGLDRANPLGQMQSLAMMLHESFGLTDVAAKLMESIESTLTQGWRTADIMEPGCKLVGTSKLAEKVADNLRNRLSSSLVPIKNKSISPALLLVDLQHDFLDRLDSVNATQSLVARVATLLSFCRQQQIPIIHIRTQTNRAGDDRMPHWIKNSFHACIEGSQGVLPPAALQEEQGEAVLHKRFFNAFNHTELAQTLRSLNVDTLIMCGLYLHGCIRSTALHAYEHGYTVWIAEDAVGSYEPLHADVSRSWLADRAASFYPVREIEERLEGKAHTPQPTCAVDIAAEAADAAWVDWRKVSLAERIALLDRWEQVLANRMPALVQLLVDEIGKPISEANGEMMRTLAHVRHSISLVQDEEEEVVNMVKLRHRPVGCYAIITPWNNPISTPVSKIAPALLFGNTVIWKPSPEAPRISTAIMDTLIEAGLTNGCVNLVFGDETVARTLMMNKQVTAVTITGSISTGRSVSALCSMLEKPLQAELGGNNACIVLADVDLPAVVDSLALAAFSFAGQRCTSIRRFIVDEKIAKEFEALLAKAVMSLHIGDPHLESTEIGPIINRKHLLKIQQAIAEAIESGARLICGGRAPDGMPEGCWWEPTLLTDVTEAAAIVQQETFGPVAIIQSAADIVDAVRLANNVPHGLLASLLTHDLNAKNYFEEHIEAGILKLVPGPLMVLPDVPFGGWKASRIGLPEHGECDREFYTRVQTVYG